ncbi:uncharacterized protein LOC142243229 [Anomaloglossus baeobatrachus]|uniref:uncharacterized protein LOC142243229 n=1 Tax=Anomaloglossus baeobatrachus TaxID=238106 RepID=UPI003F50C4AA
MLDSDTNIVKCNLCNVKGNMSSMKSHLVGINHIKLYIEKHYPSEYQSFKKSSLIKAQFTTLLKDYAKEIERTEGTQGFKTEYVSAADMKNEQENWLDEKTERTEFQDEQHKFQVLDKRQLALNYSENFKISSLAEASVVLNLTQHLSNQLEQYFFKYKGLNILDSTKSIPASTNSSPSIHGNMLPISTASQGTEDTSSSVCRYSFSMPLQLENAKGLKRKPEVSEYGSYEFNSPLDIGSTSEFQSTKRSNYKEHYNFPTMHSSSFSNMNVMVSPQHSSAEVSSSHSSFIADTYSKSSVPNEKFCVSEIFGGAMQMVKTTPQNSVSQNSFYEDNSNIALPGPSCSSSSFETNSEMPSSSKSQGKTSKGLSPDILQLLKGKDANTVRSILRTLSPFYPALQEVNLEMLSQVLVNTGALD